MFKTSNTNKNLLIGYIPSFEDDLIEQVKFARENFDFIEITLSSDLKSYNKQYLDKLKRSLEGFEVLGHINWDIDLTKPNMEEELERVFKSFEIFKSLKATKVTIHPSSNDKISLDEILRRNSSTLTKVCDYWAKEKFGFKLLIENGNRPPFNKVQNIQYLLNQNLNLGLTLDIGHAKLTSENELENFLEQLSEKIKHVHLHEANKKDHLSFTDIKILEEILTKLEKTNAPTITLEIFSTVKDGEFVLISGKKRQEVLLKQLKEIKNIIGKGEGGPCGPPC